MSVEKVDVTARTAKRPRGSVRQNTAGDRVTLDQMISWTARSLEHGS